MVFLKSKAAVNLQALMDLRGSPPSFIQLNNGKMHDVNALILLIFAARNASLAPFCPEELFGHAICAMSVQPAFQRTTPLAETAAPFELVEFVQFQ